MRVLESGSVSEIQLEEKSVFRLKKLRTLQIRRRTKSNISQSSIANAVWRGLADDFHSLWKVCSSECFNFFPNKYPPVVEAEFRYHNSRQISVTQLALALIITVVYGSIIGLSFVEHAGSRSGEMQTMFVIRSILNAICVILQWVIWVAFMFLRRLLTAHMQALGAESEGSLLIVDDDVSHARLPFASLDPFCLIGLLNGVFFVSVHSFTDDRLLALTDSGASWKNEVDLPLDDALRCNGYCPTSTGSAGDSCYFRILEVWPILSSLGFVIYVSSFQRMGSRWYLALATYFLTFYTFCRGYWSDLGSWEAQYVVDAISLAVVLAILFFSVRRNEIQRRRDFEMLRDLALNRSQAEAIERQILQTEHVNDAFAALVATAVRRVFTSVSDKRENSTPAASSIMVSMRTPAAAKQDSLQMLAQGVHQANHLVGWQRRAMRNSFIPAQNDEICVPELLLPAGAPPSDATKAGARIRDFLQTLQFRKSSEQQERLRSLVKQMRDPEFRLREYYNQCLDVFPELQLYVASPVQEMSGLNSGMSSGRTSADEFRRTIGALFAIYWLCRIDLDGKRGFCFGVRESNWEPPKAEFLDRAYANPTRSQHLPEFEQRYDFLCDADWQLLTDLMSDAKLLERGPSGGCMINVERTMAMLTLTAIHDIMKVECLLPKLLPKHAPYHGYEAGETIRDHDAALGYVLQHDPDALPCYAAMSEAQQRAVRFTQAELGFNHGWLVQAEAPPGMLFSRFREQIQEHGVNAADIAFYFVHWVTDLAGAVPMPLRGCDKFVVKFPKPVFDRIVHSMPVVQRLAHTAPTALYEQFLRAEWDAAEEELGRLEHFAQGAQAIALMRLVVQAQDVVKQLAVRDAFVALPLTHKATLARELALTGVAGEEYSISPEIVGGPAFLIYYSPAFLRHCSAQGSEDAYAALVVLSEICGAARKMWPQSPSEQGKTVTLFVDELKSCSADAILAALAEGNCWVLERIGKQEAAVKLMTVEALVAARAAGPVLHFYRSSLAPPNLEVAPAIVHAAAPPSKYRRSTCKRRSSTASAATSVSAAPCKAPAAAP